MIDNLAVSGEHAVICQVGDDSYLEDLGSTNGTTVNGQPVKKHLLHGGDLDRDRQVPAASSWPRVATTPAGGEVDFDTSQPLKREFYGPGPATIPVRQPGTAPAEQRGRPARLIRILTGANAGRELHLVKALTTIGRPGYQVAVITRRPTGYFIAHVEGDVFPSVNGVNLGSAAHSLKDKDVIELAGVQMEFLQPGAA
ncbi:MAG: FHA domain-containing protein [Comamonadaceae bacterium]|nr:FHA domain-containing protein [Comamonadaceae bacterium]